MGYGVTSPFEITSDLMIKKMWLNDNERDMIVMQHLFLAAYPDGNREVISSRMLDYGSPGHKYVHRPDSSPARRNGSKEDTGRQDKAERGLPTGTTGAI